MWSLLTRCKANCFRLYPLYPPLFACDSLTFRRGTHSRDTFLLTCFGISKPVFGINAAYPTLNNNQPINQSYLDVGHTDDSAVKFLKCADHTAPPSELSTPTLIYRLNVVVWYWHWGVSCNNQGLMVRCEWVSDCCLTIIQHFSAISWREQVNFQWDDNEVRFVLAQHAELEFL
jgi:hypothetical protein